MSNMYAILKAMTLGEFDGGKPLPPEFNGSEALGLAIIRGHDKAVQYLLDEGVDPNAASRLGPSPLHIAAGYGRVEAIAMLIAKGANPYLGQESMSTPLVAAAQTGQHACVVYLMGLGVRFNQDQNTVDRLAAEDEMFKELEAKILAEAAEPKAEETPIIEEIAMVDEMTYEDLMLVEGISEFTQNAFE